MENENADPVQDSAINYAEGHFLIPLENTGYISVNPEYRPYGSSITTTSRFHILLTDPHYGTATFYIQDGKADHLLDFLDEDFVSWVWDQIEKRDA